MKVARPELKLPRRKAKGAASAGAAKRVRVQPPAFVNDLYRDMRDRRLIVPAVALLLLIVAIPFVLAPGDPEAPVTPPPFVDPKAEAVSPAVLAAEEVSVRDFRERLDSLKRTNPFQNPFAPKASDAGDLAPPEPSSSTGGGGSTTVDAAPASPSGSSSPAPASGDDGGSTSLAPSPTPSSTSPQPQGEPQLVILAPRVNVKFGKAKQLKERDGVKTSQVLASRKTPVVMFLGAGEKLQQAKFLVSQDVVSSQGDGKCSPSASDCEFLTLKKGEKQMLRWGPTGQRYALKVRKVYEVEVDRRKVKD